MTDKTIFKDMTYNTLNKQVDGDHYKDMKIEPAYLLMRIIYHMPKAMPLSTYVVIKRRVKRRI